MTEFDLQSTVVGIHTNPTKYLNLVKEDKKYHDQIPIQRAVSYILQFGGKEAKALAAQAASAMNLGIE